MLDDHRVLVEPACGAALAVASSPRLAALARARFPRLDERGLVVEVCGGAAVSPELLAQWEREFATA